MKNFKTKKYTLEHPLLLRNSPRSKWALLLVVVLIFGYTQIGWFGGGSESDTDWLVVLHAGEAEIITIDGEMFVILSEISKNTVLFSDRPEREYQSIDTYVFLGKWDELFESSPPNATMVHSESGVDTEVVVIELFTPVVRDDEISFPIKIIGGEYTEGEIYEDVNLFIDGAKLFKWNSCYSGSNSTSGGDKFDDTCSEQWGSYPATCGSLSDMKHAPGKQCKNVCNKSNSDCPNGCYKSYDDVASGKLWASSYNCKN